MSDPVPFIAVSDWVPFVALSGDIEHLDLARIHDDPMWVLGKVEGDWRLVLFPWIDRFFRGQALLAHRREALTYRMADVFRGPVFPMALRDVREVPAHEAIHEGYKHGVSVWKMLPMPASFLASMVEAGQRYYDWLGVAGQNTGFGRGLPPTRKIEMGLACAALDIFDANALIDKFTRLVHTRVFPREVEREVKLIVRIVRGQTTRWGWSEIMDSGDKLLIYDRLHEHEVRCFIPFLRACLYWRSMPNVERHPWADKYADEAEGKGLEPLDLSGESDPTERVTELHREWNAGPALGPCFPDFTDNEERELGLALDIICREAPVRLSESIRDRQQGKAVVVDVTIKPYDGAANKAGQTETLTYNHAIPVRQEEAHSDERDDLSETRRDLLEAAQELGATSPKHSKSQAEIARKAGIAVDG
jgi:hypothetical protein